MFKRGQAVIGILLILILIVLVILSVFLAFTLSDTNISTKTTSSNSYSNTDSKNSDSQVAVKVTASNAEPLSYQKESNSAYLYSGVYPSNIRTVYPYSYVYTKNYPTKYHYTYSTTYYKYPTKIYDDNIRCRTIDVPYTTITQNHYNDGYLDYRAWKKYETYSGVIGNKVDKYTVLVQNTDRESGFFVVKFNFYNYYGEKQTVSVRKYIGHGKTEEFSYRDIYGDRYDYRTWNFEVHPERSTYNSYYDYDDDKTKISTKYRTETVCY